MLCNRLAIDPSIDKGDLDGDTAIAHVVDGGGADKELLGERSGATLDSDLADPGLFLGIGSPLDLAASAWICSLYKSS